MHLDAGLSWIPTGPMAEVSKHKVGAKVAVQASQHIQIEGSSHSGCIVVGRKQCSWSLVSFSATAGREVRAKQKSVAGKKLSAEITKDISRVLRLEIPDA
jgi:hypothetical protein